MEQENFEILPGKVYVRGFLRNYARFLGLDGEALVEQYNNYVASQESENFKQNNVRASITKGTPGRHYVLIAVLGVFLFAGIIMLFSGLFGNANETGNEIFKGKENNVITDQSKTNKPILNNDSQSTETAKGSEIKNSADPERVNLVLSAEGRSWMRVIVDGNVVEEGFIVSGEKKEFSGRESIKLRLGNAGVIKVKVNGEDKGYLGGKGQIVEETFGAEKTTDS